MIISMIGRTWALQRVLRPLASCAHASSVTEAWRAKAAKELKGEEADTLITRTGDVRRALGGV